MSYRPTADEHVRIPGERLLIAGVLLPLFVVFVELVTGLCTDAFFDPMPTWPHVLVVLSVPAINFALWNAASREDAEDVSPWLAVAGGAGLAVSAAYVLLFLPLLPFAFIAILAVGLGLLPFSPVFACIAGAKLMGQLSAHWTNIWQLGLSGAGLGLMALIAVDVPATATYLALGRVGGTSAEAASGVRLMRGFGDRQMLLRLCYGDNGRATGLVSVLVSMWQGGLWSGRSSADTTTARELYFRATGEAFNARPKPGDRTRRRQSLFSFDGDQGGTLVGGRAEGLSLDQSRIDASISPDDNLGYLEWTAEFANASAQSREARLTLAMPAGAVASRATLWVNGVPREASIGGRGETRVAYESVVKQQRDPLFVTTDGADRLLVQAFPVLAGASLKLRIGMTAPMEIARDGARSLALPTIADRNFTVAEDFAHSVWVEADGTVGARGGTWRTQRLAGGETRLRGEIADADLLRATPRIIAGRIVAPSVRVASVPAKYGLPALAVTQRIARAGPTQWRALTLLLDASAGNEAAGAGLEKALDAIPAGRSVGLVIAADEPVTIATAPWTPTHAARIREAIADADYEGGQDHALAEAIGETADDDADLLWVHGPQPVAFARSGARIEQAMDRDETPPRLVRYQAVAGPAFRIDGNRWFDNARTVAPTGDPGADLTALVSDLTSTAPRWNSARSEGAATGAVPGSPHIVRLWGAERIGSAPDANGKGRGPAIALARRLNIVTPISGAVVLEKDLEYTRNGLAVPNSADVPTVPEPGEWALIIVLAGLFAWMHRRRKLALV